MQHCHALGISGISYFRDICILSYRPAAFDNTGNRHQPSSLHLLSLCYHRPRTYHFDSSYSYPSSEIWATRVCQLANALRKGFLSCFLQERLSQNPTVSLFSANMSAGPCQLNQLSIVLQLFSASQVLSQPFSRKVYSRQRGCLSWFFTLLNIFYLLFFWGWNLLLSRFFKLFSGAVHRPPGNKHTSRTQAARQRPAVLLLNAPIIWYLSCPVFFAFNQPFFIFANCALISKTSPFNRKS